MIMLQVVRFTDVLRKVEHDTNGLKKVLEIRHE
jgi:hypothetical protein